MSRLIYRYMPIALIMLATLSTPLLAHVTASQFVSTPNLPQTVAQIPPHLGYGANVRDPAHIETLFAPLGFEWIKLYEQYNALPTRRLPYRVLYRLDISRADRWAGSPYRPNLAKLHDDITQIATSGRGLVEAYEIGNEPNTDWQWQGQPPDPADYVSVLQTAYAAIKAVDPQAIVVSAGLGPVGRIQDVQGQPCVGNSGNVYHDNNCRAMDEREFARQMFSRGAGAYLDAFGYHPQGFPYEPERPLDQLPPSDNGNGFAFQSLEVMHSIMQDYGLGDKSVWATEFGWLRDPSHDPDYGRHTPSWCRNIPDFQDQYGWMVVTEAQQADYVTRAFAYADAYWPWMGVMFVWNLDWHNQGWMCETGRYFSVRKDDQSDAGLASLAYAALRDMPRRSAWTFPSMKVTPGQVTWVDVWSDPHAHTATVSIENGSMTPFTWTARFDPPAPAGLRVSPISGTTPSTLTIWADASLFAIGTVNLPPSGTLALPSTFTYTLLLTADPTTTAGSPFTLPVTLRVLDHWEQVFLPLALRNYAPPPAPLTPTTRFGVAFITSAEAPADEARYQKALNTGAGIDRWPLYWSDAETSPGNFVWSAIDRAVISDTAHGLQIDAVLLNTPLFYATTGSLVAPQPRIEQRRRNDAYTAQRALVSSPYASPPQGVGDAVFADGTDLPGAAKTINPGNPWARFVYETVNRYKPGGALAQELGRSADRGVRNWEIWNEEDTDLFWSGTPQQYARLLKVAYLAARHADPQAKIIFGGMLHSDLTKLNWLRDTLAEINTYPDHDAGDWFFDSVAEHNYIYPWGTWYHLWQASEALKTYTMTTKSLWVTESGAWLCGEYPGPPCISPLDGKPVPNRVNPEEQAAFVVQNATYATWINSVIPVDTILHFQLYDDCSDPLEVPELGVIYGGGLGLARNASDAPCFRESPSPNTPRPAYASFQSVTRQLSDVTTRWRARPGWVPTDTLRPGYELFSFYRPATQERLLAMWARGYTTETAVITATSASSQLIWPDGSSHIITPTNSVYTVTLPAATLIYTATTDGSALIGGKPYFLVEPDPLGLGGPKP